MGKNKKDKGRSGVVWSTDPDFEYKHDEGKQAQSAQPGEQRLKVVLDRKMRAGKVVTLVQGFVGSDPNNFTTTLGKEGSDYTAAIFAYCLNAESVTIWKDVPGVLNADPRYFENAKLLHQISYQKTKKITPTAKESHQI